MFSKILHDNKDITLIQSLIFLKYLNGLIKF